MEKEEHHHDASTCTYDELLVQIFQALLHVRQLLALFRNVQTELEHDVGFSNQLVDDGIEIRNQLLGMLWVLDEYGYTERCGKILQSRIHEIMIARLYMYLL